MKVGWRGWVALLLVVVGLGACAASPDRPPPIASAGRLDLSRWNFDTDGPVGLDGDWELFWSAFVPPASFRAEGAPKRDALIRVPAMWNGREVAGKPLSSDGYATFRLRVRLPDNPPRLAVRFRTMGTAFTLYDHGEHVVSIGKVGSTRATSEPDWRPVVADFDTKSGELDLVLHMSNFHHRKGGPVGQIELGSASGLARDRELAVAFQMFSAGAILLIGFYHLILVALQRRDRAPILFGSLCLLLGVYTLLSGERYLATLMPWLSWATRVRLTNLTSFLALPVFITFVHLVYPAETHGKATRVIQLAMGALALLVLVTPARLYTQAIPVFHGLTLFGCIVTASALSRAVIAKRDGAMVLSVGMAFFIATIVNDVLYDNLVIHTGQYVYIGLLVFIFSQASLLSRRFARAYETIEDQTRELKQAAATREKLEAKYLQAQKMEAIGTLAGGVAHDFRNQLTVITGYTDLLLFDPATTEKQTQRIQQIREAADRSTTLTGQLLSFSRKQLLRPERVDLGAVVAHASQMLARTLPEDIEVTIAQSQDDTFAFVDQAQLEQAILNMAINARDAMPEGGELVIETGRVELGPDEVGTEHEAGTYVTLEVRDSGEGMDEETTKRVFEPFFTTKAPGKGTGLGLSMMYGLVQQSGGWVTVESTPGEGTRFRIHLPLSEPPVPSVSPEPPKVESGSEGATILVAEDDPTVRAYLVEALEQYDHNVLAPGDVDEVLEVASTHAGAIDLLISDVVMPGMSGPVLAEKIAAVRPDTPVLFVSGYTMSALQERGVVQSGIHLLTKPFSVDDLEGKVREVMDAHAAG